ncbi:MAG: Signal transduction histidine kinase, partial [Stygiobacter sp.]
MTFSVEFYDRVFHNLPDYAFIIGGEGKILDCNSNAKEKIRGLKLDNTSIHSFLNQEGSKLLNEALLTTNKIFRTRFIFSPEDTPFAEITILRLDVEPNVVDYLMMIKDVTEQYAKEVDLLRFSEVIHRTVNPTQITNANGKIIYVNPAFEKVSGYSREELIGKNPNILNSGKQGKAYWRKAWDQILSGEQWMGQVQNRRKNGELFYTEVVISPIIDENQDVIGFLGAHRDITDQKLLEQQLVRSQKMETFGTLAAGIAHEVGNPLTSISSLVQLIQRTTKDEFVGDKLELVKNQVNRINKIIRELVDFSRPSGYVMQNVDVNSVIKDAINIVQYGKKVRDITFDVSLGQNLPQVQVVADQLVQVFINILMNAVDACEGLKTTIKITSQHVDEKVDVLISD